MKNETGARWMVVDDDSAVLDAVVRLLMAVSGAQIDSFESPQTALDALAASPGKFQLVITDFGMKGMNGLDFCRQVQAASPSTKVLLATGSGMFTDESARENGFCGLLCKPFSIDTLKQTLATVNAANP